MATENSENRAFLSAKDFPRTIEGLEQEVAEQYYSDIRNYLIRTNRSQGQLRRHNSNYREQVNLYQNEIQELKGTRDRLQQAIQSLTIEKSDIMQSNREAINALESELNNMTQQIDVLAGAFGQVVDFDDPTANWGSPSLMKRIQKFLRAVRSFMFWWNQQEQLSPASSNRTLEGEADRRKSEAIPVDESFSTRQHSPQLYTDPASVNRSLREDS